MTGATGPRSGDLGILVVEDDMLVSMYIQDVLEDLGYTVIGPAANRQEAIAIAEQKQPAVAVLDVTLSSDREGIALAHDLKAQRKMAIVFMSGHGDLGNDPDVISVAPAAILQKPCTAEDIDAALRRAAASLKLPQT